MPDPILTVAEFGLAEAGLSRFGFDPVDTRPESGVGDYGPRYAWVEDVTFALYDEEVDVAGQINFEIEKGATFLHTVRWENRDGTPVDLTSATVAMQIRKTRATDGVLVLDASSYLTVTPLEGKIVIEIPAAVTSTLEAGAWFYDLVVTLPAQVFRLLEGEAVVDGGVTA